MNTLLFTLRLAPLNRGLAGRDPHILLAGDHQLELLKRLDRVTAGRRHHSLRIRFAEQGNSLAGLATDSIDLAVVEAPSADCLGELVRVARKAILIRR